MFVRTYMTPDPVVVSPDDNFPQAMDVIRKHKIRRLPVVEAGRLVGIVVEKDLLAIQPSSATTMSLHEIRSLVESIRMRQIMSRPVIAVEGNCPIEEAARIMLEKDIACLPVMQGEKLVGIITKADVLKGLVEMMGGEEDGLRLTLCLPDRVGELASLAGLIASAGGNIIAVSASRVLEDGRRQVTIKESGANQETLEWLMEDAEVEVLEVQTSARYEPRLFG